MGDSRCYLIRDGHLNCLTRAVGALAQLDVSYRRELLLPGDKLFLCSDGLTNSIANADLEEMRKINNNAGSLVDVLIMTFVNGIRLEIRQRLNSNDLVRVGWNEFRFIDEEENALEKTAYILD